MTLQKPPIIIPLQSPCYGVQTVRSPGPAQGKHASLFQQFVYQFKGNSLSLIPRSVGIELTGGCREEGSMIPISYRYSYIWYPPKTYLS